MKRTILISAFTLIGTAAYSQSFSDFFTTYKDASTQSTQRQQSGSSYNNTRSNNGVSQYNVMDVDKLLQQVSPQNIQTTDGVFLYGGQFYSVKLKVGVSGTNRNQIVVCGYWDGQMWNNSTFYASPIGYGAPDQIRRACTYEVYISSLGTVYF